MKGRKLLTAALAGAMALTLGACDMTGGKGGGSAAKGPLGTVTDVYGMGAVTTVELLGSTFTASSINTLTAGARFAAYAAEAPVADEGAVTEDPADPGAGTVTDPTDPGAGTEDPANPGAGEPSDPAADELETFNKYFNMLDGMLGDDVVKTETTENKDEGYLDYATKLTITSVGLDGQKIEHVMYYNETAASTDPADPDDDEDADETETEGAYTLDGVLAADGVDYRLEGERAAETEGDEAESEISIRAYLDEADPTTYAEVKQEIETESGEVEKEYVYSVYAAGKLTEQTKVEFETEEKNNKTETGVTVEFLSGGAKGRYEIEKTVKNNKVEIEVEYLIDGKAGKFEIARKEQGDQIKYEYRFEDGEKVEMDKDDD